MHLEERIKNLARLIFQGRNCIHLLREISLNADSINAANFGRFFGVVQDAVLKCCALDLCKIYETPSSKYPVNSIPEICTYLETLHLKQSVQRFNEDVKKLGIDLSLSDANKGNAPIIFSKAIASHLKISPKGRKVLDGLGWLHEGLEKAKTLRDKYAAHSEIVSTAIASPSIVVMEQMFSWAETFMEIALDNFNDAYVSWNIKGDSGAYRMAVLRVMKELKIIDKY